MKKFIPLLLAVFAVTLASCEKDPDMDKLDNNYLVYTNYDKKADFKTFETYYLPDSILVIGDSVADTFNRLYYFERAAETYIRALQTGQPLRVLSPEIAEKTARELEDYPAQAERHLSELKSILVEEDSDFAQ